MHREGSIELLHLALDYFEHTGDKAEFAASILPLAVAVTDYVETYYGRNTTDGTVDVWPTQSLEGYRPGSFPPTRDNCVQNDMPWVAGLHAVLPRLLSVAAQNGVDSAQTSKWSALLDALPPLPTTQPSGPAGPRFAAAQTPYPPHAVLGGSEQPYMYPVHPYRLATVLKGGTLHDTAVRTIESACGAPTCISYGTGWQQGVMNVALLGLAPQAMAAVTDRASTTPDSGVRFPAFLPSMQDFRPNEDHLSNMRAALQCVTGIALTPTERHLLVAGSNGFLLCSLGCTHVEMCIGARGLSL